MTPKQLESIRLNIGVNQQQMADLLQCDYVSYKRYATGTRTVPRYIARSAQAFGYISDNKLMDAFFKTISK